LAQSKPSITGTAHTLPFDRLSPRDFERLCLWLIEREGFERAEHLGAAGSEQGRDLVAWREGVRWAFQCKRVLRFGPGDAEAEVDKILGVPEELRPAALVFLVACDVSDETRRRARARCGDEMTCEFWGLTELDGRVKRHPEIVEEFFEPAGDEGAEPGWWRRFRRRPVVFYPTLAFTILAAVVGLVAGLITIGADIGGARGQFQEWGLLATSTPTPAATPTPLPFAPAGEGETLIVIASFHHSEGIPDTEAHNEIRRAIQRAKEDLGYANLRVEVEPARVQADDREGAEELGERYDASMVIWGADTGVRVTVNYLNLRHPEFEAADVRISETERTQMADPSAYAEFVTQDLPGQLTFLSLLAIAKSYDIEEAYAESLDVLEKAIESLAHGTEPPEGLADAYFGLGWLHQGMGDDEQAIADYDRAIALEPDHARAYHNRGVARFDQGDLEGAIADYTQAIALDPDCASAYYSRGVARHDRGDLEGAIADYTQAIALEPDDASAYYNRGVARHDRGDLDGAIADYTQAIALDPYYARACHGRGVARSDQGDLEGAIADYTQAIALDSDWASAYYSRASARYDQRDLEGAVADLDQVIALDPDDARAYYNRAIARYDQRDLEGAIADLDQAIALEPDDASAYYNRGLARYGQLDLKGAIADYTQAIALDPDCASAYYNRGVARSDQGDLEGAIADYTQAIALDPDHAWACYNRGLVRYDQGDLEGAIADFRRYLELRPDARDRETVEELIAELEAEVPEP
jgi:tetratricopeptide (TPR) repeat protein